MKKGGATRINGQETACGSKTERSKGLGKGLLPITACKGDLISLATEKEVKEAERLIDRFLAQIS